MLRRIKGAIAGSGAAAALLRRVVPDLPVAAIPQLGIHVPTELEHMHHEGVAIGCVGRLVPEKGVDTLLQALAENRSHRWHLTVVGDGPDRQRLERLASGLRLAAAIPRAGPPPPPDARALLPQAHVLGVPAGPPPARARARRPREAEA